MEIAQLERERQIAIQNVIMQEKMVEQAKANVAQLEGRIAERTEILAEAEKKKKVLGELNKRKPRRKR